MAPLPSGAQGYACLDAETLAAWADDGLGARERAAAEAHAKDKTSSTAANALSSAPTDAATGRLAASPSAAALPQREVQAPKASAPAPSTAAQESFGRALRKEATVSDIISADSGSRWRIIPGGAVQRSTDSGSTWETQATGVSVTLEAGASPSSSVCWLVGPGGI